MAHNFVTFSTEFVWGYCHFRSALWLNFLQNYDINLHLKHKKLLIYESDLLTHVVVLYGFL